MSIITKTIIRCDKCGYEYPNDYYFRVKDWYFCEDENDEKLHFCSQECAKSYSELNDVVIFTNRKVAQKEANDYIKDDRDNFIQEMNNYFSY